MLPKIIYLHIHKTAGTSFCSDLDTIYGEDSYRFIEGDPRDTDNYIVNVYISTGQHRCIYGHIERKYLTNTFDYSLVTFLRKPTDRVISHYYFLKDHTNTLGALTLLDFAEQNTNYQTKFLGDIRNFSFIGITEEYEQSVANFKSWLGLPSEPSNCTYLNRNYNKPTVSDADRSYIDRLNGEDIELYNTMKSSHEAERMVKEIEDIL